MELFNEQVVKRENKPKNVIIKILTVLIWLLIPVVCVILAYAVTTYMIYIGFFLFLIGIYVVWYVFTSQKVEYEYSVSGDELKIAKVIALRKRKVMCKVKINEIEKMEKGEKSIENMRFAKDFTAVADINKDDENYYAVYNNPAYGRTLLVFSPNERILQAMKPHLNRDLLIKLFYEKK